jgi:hypothetical protein
MTGPDGVRQTMSSAMTLIVCLLALPVASAISLTPAWRAGGGGRGVFANAFNLVIGAAAGVLSLGVAGVFAADQLPCWMGVPNCD